MPSISSLDIISVVVLPDPKPFFCIPPASTADAAAVNPNGIKTLHFLLMISLFLVMGQEVYQEILLIESS